MKSEFLAEFGRKHRTDVVDHAGFVCSARSSTPQNQPCSCAFHVIGDDTSWEWLFNVRSVPYDRKVYAKLKVGVRRWQIRLSKRRSFLKALFILYVACLIVFTLVGDRGLWKSFGLWKECRKLDRDIATLKANIHTLRSDVGLYRDDLRTIEKYAREELHLVGEDEVHYIFRP